jgi:zeaxanthin glucosyltransferase
VAHLAFVVPPFLGHLNPMAAVARELVGRGHRATFLHMPDAERLVTERGFAFRAVGERSHPAGTLPQVLRRMGSVNGPFGLGGIIRDVAASTDMLCCDLPHALREIGADMLVCDQTEAAGGLVARHLGMPYVSVANALPLNREPSVPPPFTPWRYDPSRWGTERNRGGYRVSDLLMRPHAAVISGFAEGWKLGRLRTIEDCASPFGQISQLVRGLDFPQTELPQTFHYVGPLRGGEPIPPGFRMPPGDGRPLAYGSLGTLQGSRERLFRRIAEAAAQAGLHLVLAHGGGLTGDQVSALPGGPAAFAFVPQGAVLAKAKLAILNGGLNTVLDALAAGVPIVVVPVAFEQGAIAARLERTGASKTVSRHFLTAGRLAGAVQDVLENPRFEGAAKRLQAEIAAAGGVRLAADIVERVAVTGRPVTQDHTSRGSSDVSRAGYAS